MGAIKMRRNLRKILFETPVRAISQDDNGVVVEIDEGSWSADHLWSAGHSLFRSESVSAPLPAERDILAQHSRMGAVIKYWVPRKTLLARHWLHGIVISSDPPIISFALTLPPPSGSPASSSLHRRNNANEMDRPSYRRT